MSPDLDKKLRERHPLIFAKAPVRGNRAPDGWFDLVDEMCSAIAPYWAEHLEVIQIMSKFGRLHFYFNGEFYDHPDLYQTIGGFETRSRLLCEECGRPSNGTAEFYGHVRNLCPNHAKAYRKARRFKLFHSGRNIENADWL